MGKLMACGTCCAIISIWGVIQLIIMGIVYNMECSVLIEDVHAHHASTVSYQLFLDDVSKAYANVSLNCFIAAGIYAITLILSIACCVKARRSAGDKTIIKDCEFLDVEAGIYSVETVPEEKKPAPEVSEVEAEIDDLEKTRREIKKKKAAADELKAAAAADAKKAAAAAEAKVAQDVINK